jgi:hypothetical protein
VTRRSVGPRAALALLLGAVLVATGCQGDDGGSGVVDTDRDGFPAGLDCNDSDPSVHTTVTVYLDADGDGVGAGPPATPCTDGTAPPGYSLLGTDCAPNDAAAWRAVTSLPVDRDGDGATALEAVQLCVGATLPAPYLAAENGKDCDDADPALFRWVILYLDRDGDGVGAGSRSISCLGATIPAGWIRVGSDIDDLDPAVWADPEVDDLLRLLD